MLPHRGKLVGAQSPRLAQDVIRHPDLSDIVQQTGDPQGVLGVALRFAGDRRCPEQRR